jgi:O-acetyl-ADP-ribose deacetylase (regulator of RNase III)
MAPQMVGSVTNIANAIIGSLDVHVCEGAFVDVCRDFKVDCLVSPANQELRNDGGLAAAIEAMAGARRLRDTLKVQPTLAVGSVLSTAIAPGSCPLADLGVSIVVHTVVPNLADGGHPNEIQRSVFRSAIRGSLKEASDSKVAVIGLCGVGAGIFGWEPADAAQEIVRAVREHAATEAGEGGCAGTLKGVVLYDSNKDVVKAFADTLLKPFRRVVKEIGTWRVATFAVRSTIHALVLLFTCVPFTVFH